MLVIMKAQTSFKPLLNPQKDLEMNAQDKDQKAAEAAAAKQAAAAAKAQALAQAKAQKEAEKAAKAQAAEAQKAAKAAEKAQKAAEKEAAKQAKSAQPQMPEQNGVRRPKEDTACGKCWAIYDSMSAQLGSPVSIAAALKQGEAQGLNEATIKTQYNRWRTFFGVTGRIVDPAIAAEKQAKIDAKNAAKQAKEAEKAAKAETAAAAKAAKEQAKAAEKAAKEQAKAQKQAEAAAAKAAAEAAKANQGA